MSEDNISKLQMLSGDDGRYKFVDEDKEQNMKEEIEKKDKEIADLIKKLQEANNKNKEQERQTKEKDRIIHLLKMSKAELESKNKEQKKKLINKKKKIKS